MIRVTCVACGRKYKFSDETSGRRARCRECKAAIVVAESADASIPPIIRRKKRQTSPQERQYYVKTGNQVRGPFSMSRLQKLADKGILKRFHLVSTDRKRWRKASSLGLFPEAGRSDVPGAVPTNVTSHSQKEETKSHGVDSGGFLDFSLDDVEDTSVPVCRSCGADADHEAEECPECGMIPATGRPPKNPDEDLTSHELECKNGYELGAARYRELNPSENETNDSLPTCSHCSAKMRHVRQRGQLTGTKLCAECDIRPGVCPLCDSVLRSDSAQQCSECHSAWHALSLDRLIEVATAKPVKRHGENGEEVVNSFAPVEQFLTAVFCFLVALVVVSIWGALPDEPIGKYAPRGDAVVPVIIGLSVVIRAFLPVLLPLLLEILSILVVPLALIILPFLGIYELVRKLRSKRDG